MSTMTAPTTCPADCRCVTCSVTVEGADCFGCGHRVPELPPLETEEERQDRLRAAFASLPPATPCPAPVLDRARQIAQERFDRDGLPRGLADAV